MIQRLRGFAAGPPPDAVDAASLLRLVFLAVFGAQVMLALLVGAVLAALVPGSGAANDVIALVLLAMAVFHLPLGWLLGRAAIRSGGRQAALSGVIAAGTLLSIPAWFGALLALSGQRAVYLVGIVSVVAIGSSLGFALTGLAARVAATPEHDATAAVPAAPPPESAADAPESAAIAAEDDATVFGPPRQSEEPTA